MFALISAAVLLPVAFSLPAMAQPTLDQSAANVESAIQGNMNRAGQQGQPTLGQLGGVLGGSTGNDAGGGAGGDSSGGGGGGGGGAGSGGV